MPSSVRFDVTAETKDFESAYQRAAREVLKLEEANRRLAAQSKTFAKDARDQNQLMSEGLGGMISRAGAAFAAYAGLSQMIKTINADLETQKRLQRETAQTQLGTAAAEREFIVNAGAITGGQRDRALSEINRIASSRNISRADALRGASAGIGFAGQVDPTLRALDVAARFNPNDVSALTPGLLATRNVTRSENALENLGFLVGVQQTSPIKSTSLLAENLIPAAAGVRLYGDSDTEAAALVNALGFALTDPTGQQSGTAAQRLSAVLGKQLPGMRSTRERIEYLQKNPAAAKRAAGGIEQGATKAALVSLISDPNSQAAQAFRESLGSIPERGQRVAVAEAAIANAGGTSVQRLSDLDRSLAAGTEGLQFGGTADPLAAAGAVRERLNDLEVKLGVPTIGRWQRWMMDVGASLAGRDPLESLMVQARFLEKVAPEVGRADAAPQIAEMVAEIRALRGELGRSTRQNATNDLNTHTEGR